MTYYNRLKELFSNRTNLNIEGLKTISFGREGANPTEIKHWGNHFTSLIPNDYVDFLKIWNGCTLFDLDQQAGFTFFGTTEIERETVSFKETYEDDWDDSIVLFCSVTGSGDFVGFRMLENDYEIIDCCHDDLPNDWIVISKSFSEFMIQLLDAKGASFWLNG